MKTAPKGYYRNLISNPHVRIAFTHTPIYGCTEVSPQNVIDELKKSNDEYAEYYIHGLENGSMVTIVENSHIADNRYFSPGELYLKS